MAPLHLNKQTAGYKLPYDWLVRLCVIDEAEKDSDWCHLGFDRTSGYIPHDALHNLQPSLLYKYLW